MFEAFCQVRDNRPISFPISEIALSFPLLRRGVVPGKEDPSDAAKIRTKERLSTFASQALEIARNGQGNP
jgi:hypothetical protein